MRLSCVKFIVSLALLLSAFSSFARNHVIYTVDEDLPMGFENEVLRRNYYINMGSNQGLDKGATLNVYRVISKLNPYDNQQRVNYKVKIGELEVLHTEDESAITIMKSFEDGQKAPLFEISGFMIGDSVGVAVN